MNLSEQLLAALTAYGLPAIFGTTFINSVGIPVPEALILLAAGSFVELGDLSLGWVIVLASIGAILGDQVGYVVGRWGGRRLVFLLTRWLGGEKRLRDVESVAQKWGGMGVFLSRWLVTGLGSWVNLASGITAFSYARFLVWDIAGEVISAVLYVLVGKLFSDQVQALIELLGNLVWVEIGLIAAGIFGWQLIKARRKEKG
ncbi:MAG: DedA family protein [Chloroflexi bacterium]|nr:DedA family protein [Chloroflexota bacterium]